MIQKDYKIKILDLPQQPDDYLDKIFKDIQGMKQPDLKGKIKIPNKTLLYKSLKKNPELYTALKSWERIDEKLKKKSK